jgi:Uncharacterized conserved protein (DUF2299)
MAENKNAVWTQGLTVNLASNLIAFIVGGSVTYLQHEGSAWVKPMLFGGAAWLITFCSILFVRVSRNLPIKVKPVTVDNVQHRLRDWLDKYNMTVKSISDSVSHFFFIVTTDGGKKISILRTKDQFSDYISVKGLITAGPEEKKYLETLTEDEKVAASLAMKLELSRAVMGYRTDKGILEDVTIFKRVPIGPALNEEEIFKLVWEVEAMLGTIYIVGAMAVHQHQTKNKDENNEAGNKLTLTHEQAN